jgi:hypothetical protein
VNGDDHIIGVKKDVLEWFDMRKMKEFFESFGMTYTDPYKNPEVPKWYKLEDVVYLQRKFVEFENGVLGRRPLDDILQPLNWVRKGPVRELVQQILDSVCQELWMWGREEYDFWTEKTLSVARQHQIPLQVESWEYHLSYWRTHFDADKPGPFPIENYEDVKDNE